ncbi:hypothetical protein JYK14_24295 [Siccirubricoccus sp. KC 17139]|uniref:Uncharacterized protein n=1 Tax=Siccirubricoccus soli TaxID=2899147 RepID=A0ABT1DBE0_9PROT|nr:hypothetical protein [Siccirubricoccus soli]MCO6419257.1 hypothetical protein [Siccirubricoccus soli]MCP2685392.1 hypothetical protein [Siccirubricoccus soli]
MPDLTDYAKNLLGRALCARSPALPAAVYLGLGTGGSTATGLSGEPTGNGYARQRVTFSGTGPQQNTDAVTFTFTAAAGTLTHVGLFDAVSGGNALTFSALAQAAAVTGAGTVTINPAGLVLAAS